MLDIKVAFILPVVEASSTREGNQKLILGQHSRSIFQHFHRRSWGWDRCMKRWWLIRLRLCIGSPRTKRSLETGGGIVTNRSFGCGGITRTNRTSRAHTSKVTIVIKIFPTVPRKLFVDRMVNVHLGLMIEVLSDIVSKHVIMSMETFHFTVSSTQATVSPGRIGNSLGDKDFGIGLLDMLFHVVLVELMQLTKTSDLGIGTASTATLKNKSVRHVNQNE